VSNIIIRAQLTASPQASVVGEEYTVFGETRYAEIVRRIEDSQADVLVSMLQGETNAALFGELRRVGLLSGRLTTLLARMAEEDIRVLGPELLAGQLIAASYFQTTDTARNRAFVAAFKARYGAERVTDDAVASGYASVYLWKAAVERAGSLELSNVRAAAKGLEMDMPDGTVRLNPENQYLSKTARVGIVRPDGQIVEIWRSDRAIEPDPFLSGHAWAAGIRPRAAMPRP
jgi:urea transport system substrate-binding protein